MDLFDDARDDVKVGGPLAEDLDQPEPLAIELHVLRKGALLREIVRVRPPPISERPVSLGLLVGEGLVDVLEPPPRQLDRLDDRARPALAVVHDPSLPDLDAFEALARGPAGGRFRSGEHEFEQFIRESGAVAEREAFQVRHYSRAGFEKQRERLSGATERNPRCAHKC